MLRLPSVLLRPAAASAAAAAAVAAAVCIGYARWYIVPPPKVALKKSKSCAKLVAEVAQKVALKLRAIWLIRPPGTTVPDGLMFYRKCIFFFLFRHSFSELPRPIDLKLCHMVGIWLNFIIPLQEFGGRSPKKFGGEKHAKFRSILDHFRL